MHPDQIFWLAGGIVAVGGALGAFHKFVVRPVLHFIRRFNRVVDTWAGEPARDGLPARPGLVDRVISIEYELKPNSGGSMRDAVNRIDDAAKVAAASATAAAEMATATKDALDEHIAQAALIVKRGDKTETELRRAIGDLSKALPIIAASTPHEDD